MCQAFSSAALFSGCGQDTSSKTGVKVTGKLMSEGKALEVVEAGGATPPVKVLVGPSSATKGGKGPFGGDAKPSGELLARIAGHQTVAAEKNGRDGSSVISSSCCRAGRRSCIITGSEIYLVR